MQKFSISHIFQQGDSFTLVLSHWPIGVQETDFLEVSGLPYILESNQHLVFATFLNEKKLVRASNPHLSFNRPLPTGRLFE
jgi:hypothetical protein